LGGNACFAVHFPVFCQCQSDSGGLSRLFWFVDCVWAGVKEWKRRQRQWPVDLHRRANEQWVHGGSCYSVPCVFTKVSSLDFTFYIVGSSWVDVMLHSLGKIDEDCLVYFSLKKLF